MPDLQVASTTDTQDQVNQAAGVTEEIKKAGDEQIDSVEQEEVPPKQEETPQKKEPDVKLLKRIDKLTAQMKAEKERADALEAKINAGAKVAADALEKVEEKPAPKTDDPEPKQEDFETYEAWIKAQTRWEIREEMREQAAKEAKDAEDAAAQQVIGTYNERVAEFKNTVDDWEETVGNPNIIIHPGVQIALMEMEEGPQLAYMLGKNPKLAETLFGMSEARAVAEIGRIAATLEKETPMEPTRKGPDKLPVSSAPPPVKPLTGHATRSAVNLNDPDLSYSDYRKIRDKQERERYRR